MFFRATVRIINVNPELVPRREGYGLGWRFGVKMSLVIQECQRTKDKGLRIKKKKKGTRVLSSFANFELSWAREEWPFQQFVPICNSVFINYEFY